MPQSNARSYSFLLYLLAFLLFWEWLRPLTVITDTSNIDYFIGFAAFSFFLSYLRFPIWITSPAKFIALIYALHMLFFYNTSFFSGLWIDFFLDDFKKNMIFLFDGNWVGLTNLFRSFLFFILLWIVSYLMHYWLIQTRKLFLFFFVTVIYLTVLDTFTMYHADSAIVRTMIIGLILLGLLRVLNIQDRERVVFEKGRLPVHWILALAIMIAMTSVVGYAAPKIGPQWPDPVPFITKATNGYGDKAGTAPGGAGAGQTIGYDSDDTRLGGSFIMDQTPVFSTIGKHSHYWRVAMKDVYTGKGWVTNSKDFVGLDYKNLSGYPLLNLYEKDTQVEKDTDNVHFLGDTFPQLIYGGSILSVKSDHLDELDLNKETGELQPMFHGRHVTLKDYQVGFQYASFSIPKLKSVTDKTGDSEAIKSEYLQLPADLPKRIEKLAESITQNATNRYDKANAVVNYLTSGEYQYMTTDVPVPGKDQDYVDQFLFDSKRGYCDNFSTSMAVMLRSIGIPARWVKGFTQGEYKSTPSSNQYEYIVKNSDAHSWVEVYFPGSGWVPFEPTKGFDNIFQFTYTDTTTQSNTTPAPVKKPEKKQPNQEHKTPTQANSDSSWLSHFDVKILYKSFYVVLALLLIAALILFRTRKKWLPAFIIRRYRKRNDPEALDAAFNRLLKLLALYGHTKKTHQTLREYASIVDRALGISDMKAFALIYEKSRYYHATPEHWQESKQFWENIIIKLRG